MTDAEYVFKRTNSERKTMANGARHKKCGSKSKKCTMPSEYLTKKQKKGLNGPVMNYKIKGLTYEEFKKYPADIQIDILKTFAEHDGRIVDVAKYLGTKPDNFDMFIRKRGMAPILVKRGGSPYPSEKWKEYVAKLSEEPDISDKIDDVSTPISKVPRDLMQSLVFQNVVYPTAGSLHFEGLPDEVFTKIEKILGNESIYSIDISFQVRGVVNNEGI